MTSAIHLTSSDCFFWQENETNKSGNGVSARGDVSITKLNLMKFYFTIIHHLDDS